MLVNKARLATATGSGSDAVSPDQQLMEIEQLVGSASGFSKERGDQLKVTAVAFMDSAAALPAIAGPGIVELLVRQAGTVINAGAILIMAVLLIWFGLRPATARANFAGACFMSAIGSRPARYSSVFRRYARSAGVMGTRFEDRERGCAPRGRARRAFARRALGNRFTRLSLFW